MNTTNWFPDIAWLRGGTNYTKTSCTCRFLAISLNVFPFEFTTRLREQLNSSPLYLVCICTFLPASRYLVYTFSFSFRVEKMSRECLDKDNINLCAVSLESNRLSLSLSLSYMALRAGSEPARGVGRKVQIQTRYKGDELSCSRRRVVTDLEPPPSNLN